MKYLINIIIYALLSHQLFAQVPAPAKPQSKPILILGGTAHIGDGTVINNAAIAFDKGKITSVSSSGEFTSDQSEFEVIDATGKHIYPGFILPNTDLGLREVSAVRATIDDAETGVLKPHIRSIIAYNTDSELIPTLRFNGILTAQVTPQGGTVAGTSSVVQLDAWNWEDAVIKMDNGLHINWPRKKLPPRWWLGENEPRVNENYAQSLAELKELIRSAYAYNNSSRSPKNLKLEAMSGIFDGSKKVFIRTGKANQIIESIEFLKKYDIKEIVLVGAGDVAYVKDYIKENDIAVILGNLHRKPSRPEEDIDLPYRLPAILDQAGITYCLGYQGVSNARNLPFFAGTSVAYGVDKEAAIKSVTMNAAEIIGVSDFLGSLTVGKQATLFISEGDALDMLGNNVTTIFIQGRNVELDAMQQRLYLKYKEKYSITD